MCSPYIAHILVLYYTRIWPESLLQLFALDTLVAYTGLKLAQQNPPKPTNPYEIPSDMVTKLVTDFEESYPCPAFGS